MAVAVSKAETLSRPLSGRHSMSRVDSHSFVERLSGPLAVAVEPMAIAVSKAETLNRPVSGRHRVSRVDSYSSVEGLSGPLAVAGVELSPLLERAGSTRVRLADSVAGGQFVSVDIVAVLKGGGESDSVTDSISDGSIGGPLAVAGVKLSPLLERSRSATTSTDTN